MVVEKHKNKPYRRADYTGINCDINMWVAKFLPFERKNSN